MISDKNTLEKWVDVEHEYYRELERFFDTKMFNSIEAHNENFSYIKEALEEYLAKQPLNTISKNAKIEQNIYSPLPQQSKKQKPRRLENILFLNYNYTCTEKLYISNEYQLLANHIHGELNNPDNPIIFGYGDEIDEKYKLIEQINDNRYLENIKSIKYLETRNYTELLGFIDSDEYEIFIMGHSCGISDRTLLNTLFENKNCMSIKVFYHLKEDGTDNYSDIVRNISRNFTDKPLMRNKVVNKKDCVPLA